MANCGIGEFLVKVGIFAVQSYDFFKHTSVKLLCELDEVCYFEFRLEHLTYYDGSQSDANGQRSSRLSLLHKLLKNTNSILS